MSVICPVKPQTYSHNFEFVGSQYTVSSGHLLLQVGIDAVSHWPQIPIMCLAPALMCEPRQGSLALTIGWVVERTKAKRSGSLIWNTLPDYDFVPYVVQGPRSHSPLSLGATFYSGSGVGRHKIKDLRTWAVFTIYKKIKKVHLLWGFSSSS